jgi:UDP-N-acetylmuramoylalanine--D-glutamate ligase
MDVAGKCVTVMGLGRHGGGLGAARYLARHGAQVTVTDLADESALADSIRALADVPIARWRLGGHEETDFASAEWLVVNPAVRPDHPLVQLAQRSGARVTSEIELFLDACPSRIVGVTGSNGKSSTATMIADILKLSGNRTWLGGNLGGSLLDDVDRMQADDLVVLELSSFQLYWLRPDCPMPNVAVVTNCTPNHLDWHGSPEHYAKAKQRLLRGQSADGIAILDRHAPGLGSWAELARGRVQEPWPESKLPSLAVEGGHQRFNAGCAAAAAAALGCSADVICQGLIHHRGLKHRLEFLGEIAGRRVYNDSKSTTPEATKAALATCPKPIWLLAGGLSKGIDLGGLAETIVKEACGAALFGDCGNELHAFVLERAPNFPCRDFPTLGEALSWCWSKSEAGATIVLSPACASHDQYRDYHHRGDAFVALVHALESCTAEVDRNARR